MKNTKNINARYNIGTGLWTIRDNGEIIKEGQGFNAYCEALKEIKATATKKIVEKIID